MAATRSNSAGISAATSFTTFTDVAEQRDFLHGLVSEAIAQHDRWAADLENNHVTAALDDAMTDLIDGFSAGDIPGSCRALSALVAEFGVAWTAWQAAVDRGGSALTPPDDACWQAWERVVDEYRGVVSPSSPPVESVVTLREQKVPDRQICEIYGWVDIQGRPEIFKVEEEIANPGKHTKDWVDPISKRRQAAEQEQRSLVAKVRRLRQAKVDRMNATAPESLEDLVRQDVPIGQIAEILRMTPDDVLAACDAAELPRPKAASEMFVDRTGLYEESLSEPMARQFASDAAESKRIRTSADDVDAVDAADADDVATDPALTVERQVIQLHLGGREPADIASELSSGGSEKVSARKVQAIIKRYSEDPEAFSSQA